MNIMIAPWLNPENRMTYMYCICNTREMGQSNFYLCFIGKQTIVFVERKRWIQKGLE